jgi:NADPH-dependent curcumin reductase CurA
MEGFIVGDYLSRYAEAEKDFVELLHSGELISHETVLQGFDQLPAALIGLFHGDNLGKQLVAVNP